MDDVLDVGRTNTVLYVDRWAEAVAFYRDVLGFAVAFENDWFVEFTVHDDSFVIIADASRSSIRAGGGAGLTLSWKVADVDAARASLSGAGVRVGELTTRFGTRVFDVFDPAGNRIELWSDSHT